MGKHINASPRTWLSVIPLHVLLTSTITQGPGPLMELGLNHWTVVPMSGFRNHYNYITKPEGNFPFKVSAFQ